jgi:hypothetical protein
MEGERHMEEAKKVTYISMQGAAKRLGCSSPTVRRVARQCGLGITTEKNRIVALALHELPLLKPHIHETSGNPDWIATRGKKLKPKKR